MLLNTYSRHRVLLVVLCGLLLTGQVARAASSAPSAAPVKASVLPDYGGRDSVGGAVAPGTPLNPMSQAWRAFEALAIVLAMVIGGLYLLKRSGLIKTDDQLTMKMPAAPKPTAFSISSLIRNKAGREKTPDAPAAIANAPWVTLLGSQALPNTAGASLHLVSLGGKTLLLGATAQSLSLLTELDAEWQPETESDPEFDAYLSYANDTAAHEPNETELLLSSTTMRLQAMIARSKTQTNSLRA